MPASLLRQANEYTDLQRMLIQCGVTLDEIHAKSGVSISTISRVLDSESFARCNHASVVKVRSAVRDLVPSFITVSFDEYDSQLVSS